MSKSTHCALAAIAMLAPQVAAADPAAPALLGDWQAACDAWGTPATCTAVWRAGKHPSHLVQDYTIVSTADGTQTFAGRGLYQIKDGAVEGIWEDSRGAILPLAGTYTEDMLSVIWGDGSREIGRSVYTLDGGGLQAVDSVLNEAGWQVFMTIEYAPLETD